MRDEVRAWADAFVLAAPGALGFVLRRRLFRARVAGGGADLGVEPGVTVTGWPNIVLGSGVRIGRGCALNAVGGSLVLGDRVALNRNVVLGADRGTIRLGRNVLVGMNTVMRAADHRFDATPAVPIIEQGHVEGSIEIGDDVWIGANVVLVAGAVVGDHCVIGAGSVVDAAIPSCSVAVGAPARVVRQIGPS